MTVGRRAASQAAGCRAGFEQYGTRYQHPVLFVAGLPKSGTTWLEKMLSSFPGYHEYLIPDVARYEVQTGGSHDYDLPADMFDRFRDALVLTKMHVHGSKHNANLLHANRIPYVVLFRDLRDVAVSNYFYVRRTPWHPEHRHYTSGDAVEGLAVFAERTLPAYVEWVRSWHENVDPQFGLILRYESMLADTAGCVRSLADHFALEADDALIEDIVERNRFQKLQKPGGDTKGTDGFFRKGVAGDWKNHFTPTLTQRYKDVIGDFLIEFGYETDKDW